MAAGASDEGLLKAWAGAVEERVLEGHSDWVHCVCFSTDGKIAVSGSHDGSIRAWNAVERHADDPLRIWANVHEGLHVNAVLASAAGQLVSGGGDRQVRVHDLATGAALLQLAGHEDAVESLAVSPDGGVVASGSADCTIKLWDARSGRELRTLKKLGGAVSSLTFSPHGSSLLSGCEDGLVRVFNMRSAKQILEIDGHAEDSIRAISLSPEGALIASGGHCSSAHDAIRLHDGKTGASVLRLRGHIGDVSSLAFAHSGAFLASGGALDQSVRVWDYRTGAKVAQLVGHTGHVNCVAVSHDDLAIASGGSDNALRLWRARPPSEAAAPAAPVAGVSAA
eukprot:tig00020538_g10384.t1